MNKKNWKEKLLDFFDTKGFYIIVAVCLLVIGFSVYTIATTDFTKYEVEQNQENKQSLNNQVKFPEIPQPQVDSKEVAKHDNLKKESSKSISTKERNEDNKSSNSNSTIRSTQSGNNSKNSNNKNKSFTALSKKQDNKKMDSNIQIGTGTSQDDVEVINPVDFKPIFPTIGKVIREFSDQSLVYSKTLDEWTEHPGIDIEAQEGSDVKACFDGTVIDLGENPLYGKYVVIDHGDGYISKYYNLKDLKDIQIGDIVRQGEKIGEVGTSSNIEYMDPPHLHFEILYNGENQNPLKFLPQTN
ncbi:Peptidase M23 [Caldicellulosiruptor acetigenus I77R1B]|uniref:Peptidase M23 n=1 Tax=Caldicellulosiruptor acetigenus (strain ATCC 700853 / DSM 12137 / I77R1B) TaxID=632335 RepID=E4S4N1_CALA7|nr:M23 family metallopeptidase [Caldicellulosiruptor acetigenus]ADQ40400.1 Peptidase M23 [Caldicellulosiruptor acetigenus I77R1B]